MRSAAIAPAAGNTRPVTSTTGRIFTPSGPTTATAIVRLRPTPPPPRPRRQTRQTRNHEPARGPAGPPPPAGKPAVPSATRHAFEHRRLDAPSCELGKERHRLDQRREAVHAGSGPAAGGKTRCDAGEAGSRHGEDRPGSDGGAVDEAVHHRLARLATPAPHFDPRRSPSL